ncbi:hypothetical protein HL033_02600 [Neoehrlichia mikurensis]|uniref:hypothetical protein n=1 Tax=Neoehrlichia mikurensis TaxID=89586 RepID=UPI001C46E733|nr:hypothetical protein [Neoehrlichia mikurensis]QXK91650.1 hypothetical protein IAH97_02595 [Neoehrlichia mikurensis]QXK93341.1 hypothetical protein HL033_02600 [Neoehrlichia mikurensis]
MKKSLFFASIFLFLNVFLVFSNVKSEVDAESEFDVNNIIPYVSDELMMYYNRFFVPKTVLDGTAQEPIIGVIGRAYSNGREDKCIVGRYQLVECNKSLFLGFLKEIDKDRLQMCACTINSVELFSQKFTRVLATLPELFNDTTYNPSIRQRYLAGEDDIDMDLDQRIDKGCLNRNIPGEYGCIDISNIIMRGPNPFCNVIAHESSVKIVPIAFDKQSFFVPGVHFIVNGPNNTFHEFDVYAKLDGGQNSYNFNDIDYTINKMYRKNFDSLCINYQDKQGAATQCIPIPYLQRPILKERDDKVNIMFNNCKDYSEDKTGKDTKYCNFEMSVGDKDNNLGFSFIKPKFNIEKYDFDYSFKCEDGSDIKSNSACKAHKVYEEDANSNVKCLVNVPFFKQKHVVKRNNRHHWLNKLDKILLGYSYNVGRCDEASSLDLASMDQTLINKMTIFDSYFYMQQDTHQTDKKPCFNDMYYIYTNDRAFVGNKLCKKSVKIHDSSKKNSIACVTEFFSEDDYNNFFLTDEEDEEKGNVNVLNDMMQGMCISNFPSHEYMVRGDDNKYLLNINDDNTKCDFIKIEAWGGGESGSLDTYEVGRAGSYLMGILKLSDHMNKYLLMDIGKGGGDGVKLERVGKNTEVKLCDDALGRNCSIKLIANGGSKDVLQDSSKGYENLIHYRVATGRNHVNDNEIFIPYQNIDLASGVVRMDDKECVSKGIEKNSNKYLGAGGCARRETSSAQEGANGMVKLTCEKWSDIPGNVKEWENINCGEYLTKLSQLSHKCSKEFPETLNAIIDMMHKSQFCRASNKESLHLINEFIDSIKTIANNSDNENVTNMVTRLADKLQDKFALDKNKVMSHMQNLIKSCTKLPMDNKQYSHQLREDREDMYQQDQSAIPDDKEISKEKEGKNRKLYDLLDFFNTLKINNNCVDKQEFMSLLDRITKQIPQKAFITRFSIDDHLMMDDSQLFTPELVIFSNKLPEYIGHFFLLINKLASKGDIDEQEIVNFITKSLHNGWDEKLKALGIDMMILLNLFRACSGKLTTINIGDGSVIDKKNSQKIASDKLEKDDLVVLLGEFKQNNICRDKEQFVQTLDYLINKIPNAKFHKSLHFPKPIENLVLLIEELAKNGKQIDQLTYSKKVLDFVNTIRNNPSDKQIFLDLGLDVETRPKRFPKQRYTDAYGEVSELEMPSDDLTEIFVNLFIDCVTLEIVAYPYWSTDAHYIHLR